MPVTVPCGAAFQHPQVWVFLLGEQPRHRIIISLATADSLRSQSPHAPIVYEIISVGRCHHAKFAFPAIA